jgi:hypothetical protein
MTVTENVPLKRQMVSKHIDSNKQIELKLIGTGAIQT